MANEAPLTNDMKIGKVDEIIEQIKTEKGIQVLEAKRLLGLYIDSKGSANKFPPFASIKLKIIDKSINQKELKDKYTTLLKKYCGKNEIEFVNVSIGEPYISFPCSPLESEVESELLHKAGEIWLLDFWATWCGPCQPAMAHNQNMLEHHPEWKGKVRILGISLDDANPQVCLLYTSPSPRDS